MPKEDMIKWLDIIRTNSMDWAKEARDRANESQSHVQHLRQWYIIASLADAVVTLSYALKQQIDPHADFSRKEK